MKKAMVAVLLIISLVASVSCSNEVITAQEDSLADSFVDNPIDSTSDPVIDPTTDSLKNPNSEDKEDTKSELPVGFDQSIKHEGEGWELLSEGENYQLFHKAKISEYQYYYYYIYDKNHDVAEEGGFGRGGRTLTLTQISSNVVRMESWIGIGPATRWRRYYSVSLDRFSNIYWDVYDEYGEVIVHQSNHKTLIVRDMFEDEVYFVELSMFSKPFADNPAPFLGAKFLNDGKSLEVLYMTADKENFKFTEIVDII